ncbi:MAG: isoleucine--tRNA ligase [Candidatus Omnitrophota bacterium]
MDYKSTLNLPKTDFSMKADLPKREPAFLKAWYDLDVYGLLRQKLKGKVKYVLHDGPPYANGDIHIGHVLNKTLKDIIIKYKSMQGFDSPYVPGWDCHGLPVEHQLFKELGINKNQIEKVEFRKKAKAYANKYVSLQKEQFKRLGVFGDWQNPYLTLNPEYEEAIVRSFGALVKDGYIYRGLKPVNWCYVCETALAEAEVEYEDHASPSICVKFEILSLQNKIKDISNKKVYAVVWTTTPWTLIANVAIAVHPHFKYRLLEVGEEIWLIQEDRVIPVMEQIGIKDYKKIDFIEGRDLEGVSYKDIFKPERSAAFRFVLAEYVSKEEGTGCVHTAPGHGQEDYLTGQRYNLETVMPVNSKGEFYQDKAMEFKGQHVFTANKNIIDKLENQGNLLCSGQITHSYPHCWRCKTPIIFRATEQWFLDIDNKDLRSRLVDTVKKDIQWVPASGEERILGMIQLRPAWCLSRQRYWGVPIPALACSDCTKNFLEPKVIEIFAKMVQKEGSDVWFIRDVKEFLPKDIKCPNCAGDSFVKTYDILDVWFDSGVSHQAVLKKREELDFPCELYLEGSDQHRGWFQASLIPSMAIDNKPPFKTVLTHGFVVDGKGQKMSKSLGNVISPFDIIKDFGADILRLWVAASDYNEDIRISGEIMNRLAEAYRKIRNTARFILSNLYDFNPDCDKVSYGNLRKIDRWIFKKLENSRQEISAAYENFEFYKAYKGIYSFCNEELSMYYLDMVKGRLYTYAADSVERRAAQTAIYEILRVLTSMMAPILVFTAEDIFRCMPKEKKDLTFKSIHLSDWPQKNSVFSEESVAADNSIESELKPVIELIPDIAKALEEKRSSGVIGSSFDAKINLLTNDENRYTFLTSLKEELPEILKASQVCITKSDKSVSFAIEVNKADGEKCVRCWNYSGLVGKDTNHPLICDKCLEAIGGK